MTEEREQKMQFIFKTHPKTDEFHVTSDDTAFFTASDAANYADTLEDKEVDLIKRRDVLEEVIITMDTPDKEDAAKAKTEERKALFEKLAVLGGEAAKTIGTEKLKAKVAELEKAKGEKQNAEGSGAETEVIVTQEMLDANPDLIEQGVKVGDTIGIPEKE